MGWWPSISILSMAQTMSQSHRRGSTTPLTSLLQFMSWLSSEGLQTKQSHYTKGSSLR